MKWALRDEGFLVELNQLKRTSVQRDARSIYVLCFSSPLLVTLVYISSYAVVLGYFPSVSGVHL